MDSFQLSESIENYLEVILDLEKSNKVARAKEIAERLNINRGSVTGGLKNLNEKGLINYQPYSYVTLTPKGKRIAAEITRRHEILRDFLENVLGVDPITAEKNACRMEHAIDRKTVDRLVCFVDYIYQCPRAGEDWLQAFVRYCSTEKSECPDCKTCIQEIQTKS
jgi:DtxR family Mn-dependent transcriptional regulator